MWIHPHIPFHDHSGPAPRLFTWCRRQKSPPFTSPATEVCSRSRIRPQGSAWIPHHSRSPVETSHKHSEKGCGVVWCSRTRSRFTSQPTRCLEPWHNRHPCACCGGRSSAAPDTSPTCSQFVATTSACSPCWIAGAPPGLSSIPCPGRGYSSSSPMSLLVPRRQCKARQELTASAAGIHSEKAAPPGVRC